MGFSDLHEHEPDRIPELTVACLSRFSRDGAIDVEQLAGSLVPQLIASVARISDGED